jgi:hypothetical protein
LSSLEGSRLISFILFFNIKARRNNILRSATVKETVELYARRREMYRLYIDEVKMSEIIEKLSAKYRVSKWDLWADWQKWTHWVYAVFDLEPPRGVRSA